jgi:hypothetical protein
MAFNAAAPTIRQLVDEYLFEMINLDAPDWYISAKHGIVLNAPDAPNIELHFAPGLLEVLEADAPPPPEYFMSTPVANQDSKDWGVYAVLLTKDGCEPALCIGSGTESKEGVKRRVTVYQDKKHGLLPFLVRKYFDMGYDLAHVGLLCWSDQPEVTIQPRIRQRFLALEGTFTNLFYSAIPSPKDVLWEDSMPFQRNDIAWLPLNTHSPFNESAENLHLTPAELLQAKEQRRLMQQEAHKRTRTRALASKRYFCDTCNTPFANSSGLKKHNESASHERAVGIANGTVKPPKLVSANTLAARISAQKVMDAKTFYCSMCDKPFPCKIKLTNHINGKVHRNLAARLASRSSTGSSTSSSTSS